MSKTDLFNLKTLGDLHTRERRSRDLQTSPKTCTVSTLIHFCDLFDDKKGQLTELTFRQKFAHWTENNNTEILLRLSYLLLFRG